MRGLIDLSEWLNSAEAETILASRSTDRYVRPGCAKDLARRGRIRFIDLGARSQLYNRQDIENFRFSGRGVKPKRPDDAA